MKQNSKSFSRNKLTRLLYLFLLLLILLGLNACFSKSQRVVPNYYVLDYHKGTENPNLRLSKPFPLALEVVETNIPKTYNRNQIIVKEHFSKIKYLSTELWATRLYDAVPNLIAQRIRAYNIFQRVDRDLGEIDPNYAMETSILNIEIIEDEIPMAFLRMEFFLREVNSQKIVMSYQNASTRLLRDRSMVYAVQSFNELIMQETDVFAAKTIEFLSGKTVYKAPQIVIAEATRVTKERMDIDDTQYQYGELVVPLIRETDVQMQYSVHQLDEMKNVVDRFFGDFDQALKLKPGNYVAFLDENNQLQKPFVIEARTRTVLQPDWGELIITVLDESQNKVRMNYDIYRKNPKDEGFYHLNQSYSIGEDEVGEQDKIWILEPGNYMVKLQGGAWNDFRDFATVEVTEGTRKTLTIVVNLQGESTVLIGAGVLGDEDLLLDRRKIHRGALHGSVTLSSDNSVDKNEPNRSFILSGQFDNRIEYHVLKFHLTMRSMYDLGMNISTGEDFKIDMDDYTFRNTMLFLPFDKSAHFKNLGLYGRADLSTHFFDEQTHFKNKPNLIFKNAEGDSLYTLLGQDSFRSKIAFYPMRLREGTGITYRMIFGPNVSLSLRGGYGWQQEYKRLSYVKDESEFVVDGDSYSVYREEQDLVTRGFESTLILTALNILRFLSISSTFDVLFPMETTDNDPKFFSENRFNIRLHRNVSLDVKADVKYDIANKDYVIFNYSSFLRLSLYY